MAAERALVEKLRRSMLEDIGSGALQPGARLGSERQLAERYGVSRGTLRQVLASLSEAGLIHRVPGRGGGTFISHAKVERNLDHVVGVPAYLARQGYVAGTRVISARMRAVDEHVRRSLALRSDALVIDLQRLRLADGLPFSLDHAYFPADRFLGLLELPLGGSIYELLKKEFSVVPSEAEEYVEVVYATDEEASLLSIGAGDALIAVTRTTFDSEGDPIEFSHDLFRADRTRIMMRTPGRGLRGVPADEEHFVHIHPSSK